MYHQMALNSLQVQPACHADQASEAKHDCTQVCSSVMHLVHLPSKQKASLLQISPMVASCCFQHFDTICNLFCSVNQLFKIQLTTFARLHNSWAWLMT